MHRIVTAGRSSPLGATIVHGGVNLSVFSRSAAAIELLLFDREDDARPSRVIPLDPTTSRSYHYWHVFVPGLQPGGALWNDAAAKALLRWAAAERGAWLDAVTNDPLLPGRILQSDYLGQQAMVAVRRHRATPWVNRPQDFQALQGRQNKASNHALRPQRRQKIWRQLRKSAHHGLDALSARIAPGR